MNTHSALSSASRSHPMRLRGRACRQLAPLVLAALLGSLGCQPATSSSSGPRVDEAVETATADADPAGDAAPRPSQQDAQTSAGDRQAPTSAPAASDDTPEDDLTAAAGDTGDAAEPSRLGAPSRGSHDGPGLAARGASRASSGRGEGEAIEIIFEDIQLPIQADMAFRPFMLTERVRELDGQRIRIHGYMLPDSKTRGITQFVLLKNTECKFGPGGQADHLINVLMTNGVTARYRDDPITVEGVLTVNPFQGPDGNTWSIYDLACDKVETYRRR